MDPSILEPDVADGRARRAWRTRESIVDACITVVDEGDLRPTAPRIAARAGVSVRSVFQHFDDLESLFAAVAVRLAERLAFLFVPIDASLPLDERVDALVLQRSRLLEAITPIRRAATVHGPFSHQITQHMRDGMRHLRHQVATVFAPELEALPEPQAADLLEQLDVTLSWVVWDGLRSVRSHDADRAREIVHAMVTAVLAAAT
jgi:AcrR family transcriptional regulator